MADVPSSPEVLDTAAMLAAEHALFEDKNKDKDERLALAALCLSGGGVRSAAFCLGVIQALAGAGLLHRFHYLSTVSGGGYIGGFLRRALAERAEVAPLDTPETFRKAISDILCGTPAPPTPDRIGQLRRNTSFLAPDPGLASLDTWSGAVLWVRNTLVNWLALAALLIGLAALALTYLATVGVLAWPEGAPGGGWHPGSAAMLLGVAGAAALGVAVFFGLCELPSHAMPDRKETPLFRRGPRSASAIRRRLRWAVVAPTCAWIALAPLAAAPFVDLSDRAAPPWSGVFPDWRRPRDAAPDRPQGAFLRDEVDVAGLARAVPPPPPPEIPVWSGAARWALVLMGSAACLGGYLLAMARLLRRGQYTAGDTLSADETRARDERSRLLFVGLLPWTLSCAVSAGLLWVGLGLAEGQSVMVMALAGPAWVAGCEVLRSTVFVALRQGGLRADLDREWIARINAAKLQPVVVLLVFAVASLLLPPLVFGRFDTVQAWLVSALAVATGPAAAFAGQSVRTVFGPGASGLAAGAAPASGLRSVLMAAGLAALAVVFGATVTMLAGRVAGLIARSFAAGIEGAGWQHLAFLLAAGGTAAAFFVATAGIDRYVNLNRFSMHAAYRNRLVRGFLGSARERRWADPFTQFDPADNIRLADCRTGTHHRLFPVINVALNETRPDDAARRERKASSFTFTPLHCGSARLDSFVRTADYAGQDRETGPFDKEKGVTLGTALTVSGAAVSPNMGYNSSAALAFIMTLFNVRLGAWLPNPGRARSRPDLMRASGPVFGLFTMLDELVGRSNARDNFVYLSDGAHFENLGCYEMLRRKCKFVLVIDAGEDKDYTYADLGHALLRAKLDLGVKVTFLQEIEIKSNRLRAQGAFGTLVYEDGSDGELIYLKPWLPTGLPTELSIFKAARDSFPHEPTVNQFFAESDFESYRRLGEHIAATVAPAVSDDGGEAGLADLFKEVRRRVDRDMGVAGREAPAAATVQADRTGS